MHHRRPIRKPAVFRAAGRLLLLTTVSSCGPTAGTDGGGDGSGGGTEGTEASVTGSLTSYDTGSGTSAGTSVGTAPGSSGISGTAGTSGTAASSTASSDGTDTDGDTGLIDCATTLFVNFDGVVLAPGQDDAPNDVSSMADMVGNTLAPYAGPVSRTDVMDELTAIFAPFPVCITDSRPEQGPYTMVVVTSTIWNDGVTSLASIDCGDQNPNNVGIVFGETIAAVPQVFAAHVAQSFGFTLGLERQGEDPEDVMGVPLGSGTTFKDTCLALVHDPPTCAAQHAVFCPAGRQNSYAEIAGMGG